MKKLLIAAAVICAAVVSEAALAVTWQTGTGVKDVSGNAFTTATTGYTAAMIFSQSADMSNPLTVAVGASATEYKTKGSAGFAGKTSEVFDAGKTYYAQLTITEDASGKVYTSQIGSFTYAAGATSAQTINFTSGANMGGSSLLGKIEYKGGSGDVPEPTSAMLLLLGVAGLALKRRVA